MKPVLSLDDDGQRRLAQLPPSFTCHIHGGRQRAKLRGPVIVTAMPFFVRLPSQTARCSVVRHCRCYPHSSPYPGGQHPYCCRPCPLSYRCGAPLSPLPFFQTRLPPCRPMPSSKAQRRSSLPKRHFSGASLSRRAQHHTNTPSAHHLCWRQAQRPSAA